MLNIQTHFISGFHFANFYIKYPWDLFKMEITFRPFELSFFHNDTEQNSQDLEVLIELRHSERCLECQNTSVP